MKARPAATRTKHGAPTCGEYGCERQECRDAYLRWRKLNHFNNDRGIKATVAPDKAQAHGKTLVDAGMPPADIAAKAGLGAATVFDLIAGRLERIHRTTEQAILALPVPPKGYIPERDGLIDSLAAQRRLRALSARGFTLQAFAREIGSSIETLGSVRQGRRRQIHASLDCAISQAYRVMWNADPLDFGISEADTKRAKAWASKAGWPPPAAWDDDEIRDPKTLPKGYRLEGGRKVWDLAV